jgi:hypothetical protein
MSIGGWPTPFPRNGGIRAFLVTRSNYPLNQANFVDKWLHPFSFLGYFAAKRHFTSPSTTEVSICRSGTVQYSFSSRSFSSRPTL